MLHNKPDKLHDSQVAPSANPGNCQGLRDFICRKCGNDVSLFQDYIILYPARIGTFTPSRNQANQIIK